MTVKWEMDDRGLHRLLAENADGVCIASGRWTVYIGVATLRFNDRHYFAVSQYFVETFPVETVLEWEVHKAAGPEA